MCRQGMPRGKGRQAGKQCKRVLRIPLRFCRMPYSVYPSCEKFILWPDTEGDDAGQLFVDNCYAFGFLSELTAECVNDRTDDEDASMRMCIMLSIMMMMLLIMRLMPMPMMTISVLGCSANGLEANQSGTHKAQCANKLLSTHLPGELGNTTPSSSSSCSPSSSLSSSSSCADTAIGIEQKQSSSLWLISKAIFVCYSYHFPPSLSLSLPYSPSISLLVLDILNAANLHISRLGALVHNAKSLADRTLPGH